VTLQLVQHDPRTLILWDVVGDRTVRELNVPGELLSPLRAAFSADGRVVAAAFRGKGDRAGEVRDSIAVSAFN
jgi:hypothetical protein